MLVETLALDRPTQDVPLRPPRSVRVAAAYSIFHEPWWLDAAAPGAWAEVRVDPGDGASASLPFHLCRRSGLLISIQPPLTRTLGPILHLASGKPATHLRRRLRLTESLIEQLPRMHFFQQTFDPRIEEALAFGACGFTVQTSYTFRIGPERSADQVWRQMTDKVRNLVRRARESLTLATLDDPDEFCRFYETNLAADARPNMYGTATMRRIVRAFLERSAGCIVGVRSADHGLVAAIALVWDTEATYFLLSTRTAAAHSGAISLLLWEAIRDALAAGRIFDFDGIASTSILRFLSGFGGSITPRLVVQRSSLLYDSARLLRRAVRRMQPVRPVTLA